MTAIDDSDRLTVIRDAFLEGRDVQAVQMIRDLDPIGVCKVLGVESGVPIIGLGTARITTRPQLSFRATHLVVSPRCAAHFNIDAIRIGNRSQFVNSCSIAADLFTTVDILHGEIDEHGFYTIKIDRSAEERLPLRIDMPVCEIGNEFIVIATNVDHGEHEFHGALLGQTVTYY